MQPDIVQEGSFLAVEVEYLEVTTASTIANVKVADKRRRLTMLLLRLIQNDNVFWNDNHFAGFAKFPELGPIFFLSQQLVNGLLPSTP